MSARSAMATGESVSDKESLRESDTDLPSAGRRHAALFGYLTKVEVDAILRQNPIRIIASNGDAAELWRRAVSARSNLPSPPVGKLEPLPAGLETLADDVRRRPSYAEHYESAAEYQFGLAPVESLVAPQWLADLEYVGELSESLGEPSAENVFKFSMPEARITDPILNGNSVVFSSPRADLFAQSVPRVHRAGPGDFEIVVTAFGRPNLVQVGVFGGRLFLLNGVHKVLALLSRGVRRIPCVWREATAIEQLGLPLRQLDLFRPEVLLGPRPALVLDFVQSEVAVEVAKAPTVQVLRVSVAVESIPAPLPIAQANPG